MNGSEAYDLGYLDSVALDPDLSIDEWANTYRYLPKESSIEPGRYRTERTPYTVEPMFELSPSSPTEWVVVMKPTQIGFTEVGNNFLMAIAHMYPGPCLVALPTDSMAIKHSKKKIAPSIRVMPCLKDVIKEPKSRDSGNTILIKEFPGGSWTLTGSNSPTSARADSIRYLMLDDIDGFVVDVGGEGDPIDLYSKRTDAYGSRKKIYINGTPTTKGISAIERVYEASSQGFYNVPCLRCGFMQRLIWGGKGFDYGIKFEFNKHNEVTAIWYVCENCKEVIEEGKKTAMMNDGVYVHEFPERKKRGFKINALYSPLGWLSWTQIAEEFLDIKGNRQKLKVWVNTRLAETFEEEGTQPDWVKLKNRCEPYEIFTVPDKALFICVGTDVQENRLVVVIRAWGEGEESWLIWAGELFGDTEQDAVYKQLDELLERSFPHESGADLYVTSAGIDSGSRTQKVYNYARSRTPRTIAVKGMAQRGKPIIGRPSKKDIDYRGDVIKSGILLWPIGTDTAKSTIYSRLALEKPGPGYYHFPIGTSEDYFMQLTAEKQVTRYVKGFPIMEWVKVRNRNDYLDAEVYAYAAALRAGLAHINWEKARENLGKGKKKKEKKESQKPKEQKRKSSKRQRW